jgi:hypothetical protein
MSTTTCSISGRVSVPSGRCGYGSDPGWRRGRKVAPTSRYPPRVRPSQSAPAPCNSARREIPRVAIRDKRERARSASFMRLQYAGCVPAVKPEIHFEALPSVKIPGRARFLRPPQFPPYEFLDPNWETHGGAGASETQEAPGVKKGPASPSATGIGLREDLVCMPAHPTSAREILPLGWG